MFRDSTMVKRCFKETLRLSLRKQDMGSKVDSLDNHEHLLATTNFLEDVTYKFTRHDETPNFFF